MIKLLSLFCVPTFNMCLEYKHWDGFTTLGCLLFLTRPLILTDCTDRGCHSKPWNIASLRQMIWFRLHLNSPSKQQAYELTFNRRRQVNKIKWRSASNQLPRVLSAFKRVSPPLAEYKQHTNMTKWSAPSRLLTWEAVRQVQAIICVIIILQAVLTGP